MSEERKCIFNCDKNAELTIIGEKRYSSIIKSSEARKDDAVKTRLKTNKANNVDSHQEG